MDPASKGELLAKRWFYRFRLPDGSETPSALPAEMEPVHETRRKMIFDLLDGLYAGRWDRVEALDLACHQGWFSSHLASRGCRRVLGIDIRRSHVEEARMISSALGLTNVSFEEGDVNRLIAGKLGTFDVVLVLGLVYHLENPIGALRLARALTRDVCIVETQIAPNLAGSVQWGSWQSTKSFAGTFAVIDETQEVESGNPEANVSTLSLVPGLEALVFILKAVGFAEVEVLKPPADGYEQFVSGNRVVVAAWVA